MTKNEHIAYWLKSAENDLKVAETLFQTGKYDWCLFIGHLVLEKIIKAIYVEVNNNKVPPRIHNLVKLAELSSIALSEEQKIFLDEVNDFNLEIRYPDYKFDFYKRCTEDFTRNYFTKIKEYAHWLKSQLK